MKWLKFWKPESGIVGGLIFGTVMVQFAFGAVYVLRWLEKFLAG